MGGLKYPRPTGAAGCPATKRVDQTRFQVHNRAYVYTSDNFNHIVAL